MLIKYSE